jgi:cysteine desulfurase/selenocysteine lyase
VNIEAIIEAIRKQFPMLSQEMHGHPLIYFDSAATAQKPQCVIDTLTNFYKGHYGTVHRAVYELSVEATRLYQQSRVRVQQFLNAKSPKEIIFTKGATEAINLVASSFGKKFVRPGDEIMITEMEHHSNIVPWQILCQDRQAILKVAPMDSRGVLDMDAFRSMLSPRTKLVSVAHISNALGTLNPLPEIIAAAHAVGAKVMVDGAQSAPHIPVDVQALDIDFFVFAGHKLYGPTGVGVLYGKEELLNEMPPYQGGGDMIETVTFEKTTYNELPLKFEAGTPIIAEVIGLGEAIAFVQSIGLQNISEWEHQLLVRATEQLSAIPDLTIFGTSPQKGAVISFNIKGIHPLDIGTMLDLHGIAVRTGHLCAQPVMRKFGTTAFVRASFALYNTPEEVDRFSEALRTIIPKLK